MKIQINSIDYKGSLVNGPGIRSLIFFQGCDNKCEGCHNTGTWDINDGEPWEINDLVADIRNNCKNKKITITGGEPLFQTDALIELLKQLCDFDICMYTGSNLNEIPLEVLTRIKYVKVGKYKSELRCTTTPYIGSTNQKFIKVRD